MKAPKALALQADCGEHAHLRPHVPYWRSATVADVAPFDEDDASTRNTSSWVIRRALGFDATVALTAGKVRRVWLYFDSYLSGVVVEVTTTPGDFAVEVRDMFGWQRLTVGLTLEETMVNVELFREGQPTTARGRVGRDRREMRVIERVLAELHGNVRKAADALAYRYRTRRALDRRIVELVAALDVPDPREGYGLSERQPREKRKGLA